MSIILTQTNKTAHGEVRGIYDEVLAPLSRLIAPAVADVGLQPTDNGETNANSFS
jgi:hypothetical protein